MSLASTAASRVTTEELVSEVDEYFTSGVVLTPGSTVFDVGANIGAFSLSAAQRCNGELRLVCFEPAPDTFRALEQNFKSDASLAKTTHTLHRMGLADEKSAGQEISFYHFKRVGTNSTFDVKGKQREFEIFFEDRAQRLKKRGGVFALLGAMLWWLTQRWVWRNGMWFFAKHAMGFTEERAKIATLADMIAREGVTRVDLLKIDVEGLELDVLRGLDAKTWPRVQQVVVETHNRDGRQTAMEKLLRDNGFAEIVVTPQKAIDNGLDSVILFAKR